MANERGEIVDGFITKEIKVKDFIPSEDELSKTNKLLICQNFGFTYDFIDPISELGKGSTNIVFDIMYRDRYGTPDTLIPRKEYEDLFVEFDEWLKSRGIFKSDYVIYKKEEFIFIDRGEPVKVVVPAKTLTFRTSNETTIKSFFQTLESFWEWSCYEVNCPSEDDKRYIGYSGTKNLFIGKQDGKH